MVTQYSIGRDPAVAGRKPALRPRAAYLIAGGFLMLGIALGAYFMVNHLSTLSQRTSGQAMAGKIAAELLQEHLQGELLGITRTLGEENGAVKAAVTGRPELDAPEVMAVLDRVRQATRATIVYILNAQGDTVACTPYDGGQTLTGRNYAFRPYFKTAIKGRDVVYPALGITTQKRGLYYSSPITGPGKGRGDAAVVGVVVIKKGLEEVDAFFKSLNRPAALLTPEGVVFSGNRPNWLLHPFFASEEKSPDDRQFGVEEKNLETVVQGGGELFQVFLGKRPHHIFISNLRLPSSEGTWRLVLLEDLSALLPVWFETAILIASLAGLAAVAAGSVSVGRHGSRPKLMAGNMFAATAVAGMGSLFFLTIYVIAGQWEANRIVNLFVSKAEATASLVSGGIKSYLGELDTLTRFAASIPAMDQARLGGFADPILARKLGLEAVFWAPGREEGTGPRRYPVALRQPVAARSFDLGLDLAADSRLAPAFRAISDGTMGDVSFIPIKDEDDQAHVRMAALAPVPAANPVAERSADRPSPLGVMVGVLDTARMLDSIVSDHPRQGMYIRVTDLASEGDPLPLYDSDPPDHMSGIGRWWAPVKLEHRIAIAVADRYWEFLATGGAEFIDLHQNRYGPGILIVGGALTCIATAYVASSARRRQQVEHLVENRTAQLAESESRVSAILESIQAGVVIVDIARKTIEYINRAAAQMAGWDKDELQGRICHLLICPNHKGRCPVTDLGQAAENAERLLLRKDGSYLPVVKTVKPITFKGRDCYIETFVDITALNNAQEALSRSERNYRLLFESATDAVLLLEDNVITDANQTASEMFGVTRGDLAGRHPADLSPPVQSCGTESYVLAQRHIQTALQQKSIRFDWLHKRQNGETFPTEVILKTLELGDRRVVQVVVRDISERKAHDDRLAETLQELERFNKVMLAREGRVLELKAEVNALMVKLGHKPEYRTAGA